MKYFSATYTDFIKFDAKPNEDFYLVSKKFPIFALADGVTQSHYKNGEYAFPNSAKEAAEIFCKTTIKYLERKIQILASPNFYDRSFLEKLKETFNFSNEKIKELNTKYGIDKKLNYIEYDWFDTVGVAGTILKNKIYYGYVGDCGLAIFDKNNKLKFQTKDEVLPAVKRFKDMYKNWKDFPQKKRTLIIHRDFRNNPDKKGYGSFSGEKGVENYYKTGIKELKSNDLLVFYSDGFLELLKDKNFVEILREQNKKKLNKFVMEKARENEQKYGHDRTFIATIFEEK